MNISIIIPNYNGEEILKRNLPEVFEVISEYKDGKKEIIVVDDASLDNSMVVLKELMSKMEKSYPSIEFILIKNDKNLGFSSTVNKGTKYAKGEILILLNTDVVPHNGFIVPLLSHFADSLVFAVGCMDESMEDGKKVLRGRGVGGWKRGFLIHSRGEVDKTNTLWVSGGSGAFRKSIWDKLGGLDSLYDPFYWEDIDLSYRALKTGYKVLFEPKSIVTHEHEKGAIKKKFTQEKIKTIAYRNQFIFVWKNTTDLNLKFLHIFWLPYYFMKAIINWDCAFFKGFLEALISLPLILNSSFKEKKSFTKTDHEIMKAFL